MFEVLFIPGSKTMAEEQAIKQTVPEPSGEMDEWKSGTMNRFFQLLKAEPGYVKGLRLPVRGIEKFQR